MKVQTFIGKAHMEGLALMDQHINDWLARHGVQPLHIKQSFGTDRHNSRGDEPIVVITVWYDENSVQAAP